MVKRLTHMFLYVLIVIGVSAQSPYWTDDFSTPEKWTYEGNWKITYGSLQFTWDPIVSDFDFSAVSEDINLDAMTTDLIITQNLNIYNLSETETAQIIIISEGNEFILWEYNLENGNWGDPAGSDIVFPLADFHGQTINLKFRTFGESTFNWSWWQIFDVKIEANYTHDLTITQIDGPNNIDLDEPGDWIVEVLNQGSDQINGYNVNLIDSRSGNILTSIEETGSIGAGETMLHYLSWTPEVSFNTVINAQVESLEDQFTGNNLSRGLFLRIEPEMEYNILVWGNDNGIQSILCPEKGDMITATQGLTRIFTDAGINYDFSYYLPDNLEDYDIVFSTMGNYCLS